MPFANEMDEFVNWDNAGAAVGDAFQNHTSLDGTSTHPNLDNIDLVLGNVDEDDFSFEALQHFTENNIDIEANNDFPIFTDTMQIDFNTPTVPCVNCTLNGYSCKKIQEGRHKGYCTSCVALTVECSFGGVVPNGLNLETVYDPNSSLFYGVNTAPEDITPEMSDLSRNASATDLTGIGSLSNETSLPKQGPPPKIGARFSRESIRILKNWLSSHNRHPYPSDEEKDMLQRQTGLNKTQITTWLANARRRGKVQPNRSTSPHVSTTWAGPVDIPRRRGTPALETMNPLQRWQHSPPENEPASVTAIARAVTASSSSVSSGLESPFSHNYTDDGSGRSLCNQSSISSLGTSHSSNGSLSAYSHGSRNSWGSFGSAPFSNRGRRRRRRVTAKKAPNGELGFSGPLKTFQCTFCTETFRTKHDWQRHEKSLHLSLERWVCTPQSPLAVNQNGQSCCTFCGIENPDNDHIESHNHSACQERTLDERTFYRKDHLNQHLRLVHNIKFQEWSMKSWKVASPEIRSRCGFCGIVMDTWTIRVDHLAEHFKTGYSMADWKGDWGFETPVLDIVENSIPPYLIHYERTSPQPFVASQSPHESPRNAYELIKLEMTYFMVNHQDQYGRPPTDVEMMVEGARIIFASELLSLQGIATQQSWLRDIVMSSEKLAHKAKFGPLRGAAENRLASLKINGKDNLFEECPMEIQLHDFVRAKGLLGLTAMDNELQEEACRIVGRVEEVSTHPSDAVANWLLRIITSSTDWLAPFRRRAHLPRSEDVKDEISRSTDPKLIDSTIHSYSRLERELADYLKLQRSLGVEPSDEDLQRQSRIIIYEFDDGWNQTAADNVAWLSAFRQRHSVEATPGTGSSPTFSLDKSVPSTISGAFNGSSITQSPTNPVTSTNADVDYANNSVKAVRYFLTDANCYARLAKELALWVASTMSPNNPNCHVPSDAELQHQARFIIYEDDDPWNSTAADNAEWLRRFKRKHGILLDSGPGLPDSSSWSIEQGGTGFAPPYAFPKSNLETFGQNIYTSNGQGKSFPASQSVANSYLENFTSRYARPAAVFCSRELEDGLTRFVESHMAGTGQMPSDEMLQGQARRILGRPTTAADDVELLQKFKDMTATRLADVGTGGVGISAGANNNLPVASTNMNMSDDEMNKIIQGMTFDFDTQDFGGVSLDLMEDVGGVSLNTTGFTD